jgi:hypothetical protein
LVADTESVLHAATYWGWTASEHQGWTEAAEAYELGLAATDHLVRTQLVREQQEAWLLEVRGFTSSAAYVLAKADAPAEAVVALEQGRAVLLSEALQRDRADLARLLQGGSDLADRYQRAAARERESHMISQPALDVTA